MTQRALGNRLFSELIQEWLTSAKAKVKPSSYAQYVKRAEKNILPYFSGAKLRDITPESVLGFVQHLQSEGYNEKYIYDLTTLLKSVLKSITRTYGYPDPTVGMEGLLTGREHADIPREPAYGEELCERLIEVLSTDTDLTKCGILMTLYTGLRIGELCALKWEDIDLDNGTLTIRRTIQRVSTEDGSVLMTTELGKRAREIPLPQALRGVLLDFRTSSDRYLLSGTTSPIEPRTMQYRLRAFLKKAYLPDISFSELRKLFIKRCLSRGADVTVLADVLGNASVQSAAAYCEKPTMRSKIEAVNLISKEVS